MRMKLLLRAQQVDPGDWLGASAGIAVGIWRGASPALQGLVLLMVLDYLTGLGAAVVNRSLSSEVAYYGLIRKTMILLAVATGYVLENHFAVPVDLDGLMSMFFVVREGISITENLGRAGVPLPEEVRTVLLKLKPGSIARPEVRHG